MAAPTPLTSNNDNVKALNRLKLLLGEGLLQWLLDL
jgi:hypothetical protein